MNDSSSSAPMQRFAPELLLAAQGMRVAFFDVDGVLTDGGVYFSEEGETLKRFSILDGYGLQLIKRAGIVPAVITGRDSKPLRVRLEALGVEHVRYGISNKLPAAEAMLQSLGLDWSQAAAMGDDWPDLPVLRRVGLAVAPANAHVEVRAAARYVTTAKGGEGAARECCDLLLMAGGHYRRLLDDLHGGAA
ncbi:HAD hydrolase family protein [Xenophilus arseniciresistens]|uniref:3-deoxy-D-manno-octulosonate 8-phosphate phosphatase KdsC n=1 Tax=Xenophilus arseniciresistens TaxID=1283306 RepID=A0AAE3NA49_9BURK|nr:HAD hydrolase family protein [Xenophilus arseniciresistens]MDA7418525.1 HAD hydrolase family protein [Xenophilus arseniciresistens]